MKKFKILIAEDEEILRDIYEMILDSEFSCDFVKCADGASAINVLEQFTDIDMIISDYNMPKANGGALYTFNKTHGNVPFVFLSGGDIADYSEFASFSQTNPLNVFFNKPFPEEKFIEGVRRIYENGATEPQSKSNNEIEIADNKFIKILLKNYAKYSNSSSEVYLKLGENKYTKIFNSSDVEAPDAQQVEHYLKKGIDYVYIQKTHFFKLVKDAVFIVENQTAAEKKPTEEYVAGGISFQVCYDGLKDIGINEIDIEAVNTVIDETVDKLLTDKRSKDLFLKYCETEGFLVGHSLLIIYIAGKICKEASYNFQSTMKRISVASFYHDFSVYEFEDIIFEMHVSQITDPLIKKKLLNHPIDSVELLPESGEVLDETKRIILEHHERPDGTGYPRNLTAAQISPLGSLFIISEQIALCLLRNNFNQDRLKDFLITSEALYSQGSFSKLFKAAQACFINQNH